MPRLSENLMREKTNVGTTATTTFNAPGNYKPPYGKTVIKVGGRGTPGNSPTGGNYAGEEYAGEGIAYYNPDTPGNVEYNPGNVVGTLYQWFDDNNSTSYNEYPGYDASNTPPYTSGNHHVEYGSYYNQGNAYYNPDTPGNEVYGPTYAPYYNPYVPGNPGATTVIGGVHFPGGAVGSQAPVVPDTTSTIAYTTDGFTVTVPTGGYVTIKNV